MLSNSFDQRKTYVVRIVLPTNVQERTREVAVCHLETIIDTPQGRAETVADTREATAGRSVRFEHHVLLAGRLRNGRSIQVRGDNVLTARMVEVILEDILWVDDRAKIPSRECGGTILIRIASQENQYGEDD